jgi:hypothetical protein
VAERIPDTDADFAASMREAEAEAGVPSDPQLYGSKLGGPVSEVVTEAEAAEIEQPVEVDPDVESAELVRSLGVDEDAATAYLDANPHVALTLPKPVDDEGVARNALIIQSLMQGEEAASGLAAASAAEKLDSAYAALYDGDPEQTVAAAAELVAEVGLHDSEFEAFVHEWGSHDPDTSVSWLQHVGGVFASAREAQDVAAWQAQYKAAEEANAELWQRTGQVMDELTAENPDMNDRLEEMGRLALESGITPDLMLNPETMRGTLGALHEAVRQMDADVVGSPAWEAEQAANILNAGGIRLKNEADRKRLIDRLPAGMYLDEQDRVVSQPVMNEQAIEAAVTPKMTKSQWEEAEKARIFGPDAERGKSFRDQVREAARNGQPGVGRTSRLGATPRDAKTGQFVAASKVVATTVGPAGQQEAVEAAPAPPGRRTEWDAYPTRPNPGQWWD